MNNLQIDNTNYYQLPCGKYLEDFIAWKGLSFAVGSAVKYLWRAGNKDGESFNKDRSKAEHYISFLAKCEGRSCDSVRDAIISLVSEAREWDGSES